MKKAYPILILMSILMIASAIASGFIVEPSIITNNIYLDQKAEFNLTITNTENFEDIYTIYSEDITWYLDTAQDILKVGPDDSETFQLDLIPNAWTGFGPKEVTIRLISSKTENFYDMTIPVYVKSWTGSTRTYEPSIEMKVTSEEKNDPRNPVPITIQLRNRNRLDIEKLDIVIQSNLISDQISFPFGPQDERTEELVFNIDKLTPPQNDTMTITLMIGNRSVNQVKKYFTISSYSDMITETDSKKELFKTTKNIILTNKGNINNKKTYKIPTTWLEKVFTKTEPKAEIVYEIGKRYYAWDIDLEPEQSISLTTITDYRPIIYLIAICLTIIIVYFIYRSAIITKKEALVIGSAKEGISEMKILMYVKNRTHEVIENINITEKIPPLAKLINESYLGTLEPSKILKHDKKGTIVKWDIKSLEPFEERIITYRIRSNLRIFGGISLPPTRIKYENNKGRERITHSNNVNLNFKYQ